MREELYSEGYGSSFFVWGEGREQPPNKSSRFSISVFGRFAYTLSALNGHCPLFMGES